MDRISSLFLDDIIEQSEMDCINSVGFDTMIERIDEEMKPEEKLHLFTEEKNDEEVTSKFDQTDSDEFDDFFDIDDEAIDYVATVNPATDKEDN